MKKKMMWDNQDLQLHLQGLEPNLREDQRANWPERWLKWRSDKHEDSPIWFRRSPEGIVGALASITSFPTVPRPLGATFRTNSRVRSWRRSIWKARDCKQPPPPFPPAAHNRTPCWSETPSSGRNKAQWNRRRFRPHGWHTNDTAGFVEKSQPVGNWKWEKLETQGCSEWVEPDLKWIKIQTRWIKIDIISLFFFFF